jgi:cytochrome c oxidase assembly protein subunit 11
MSPTGPSESQSAHDGASRPSGKNQRLAIVLVLVVTGMLGLSFASVPLYRMFCAATGFAGTPQRADIAPAKVAAETMIIRFDANVSPSLKWSFEPVQHEMTLHIGENKLAFFRATNLSSEPLTGTATFNVSPEIMGQYFTKIQCFCFTEQTLKPGETVEMPVSFFVDPAILKDRDAKTVREMTLSYTFFKSQNSAEAPTPAKQSSVQPEQSSRAAGG